MLIHWLGTGLLLGASTVLCLAEDRPPCNSENVGEMWPETANHDHKEVVRLARCGQLQMCVQHGKKFRWESLTVRIDQLRDPAKLEPGDACEVSPKAGNSGPSSAAK